MKMKEESRMTLENFNENLKKYARLIAETGVNVQDNHTVVLQISVDQAPLARLITEEAYRLGAAEVIVQWSDETIQREFLAHAATDRIENVPQYKIDQTDDWIAKGASRISVVSSNPDALAGVDAQRVAAFQAANGKALVNLRKATQANKVSWTVVAAASEGWAAKVFPELATSEEQVDALWNEIFKTTRIYEENPVIAWDIHDKKLQEKAAELNEQQFTALHYTAPGTDLTIGLPKNHLWEGAGSYNARGEEFMANMPTEEVFTAPDSRRVDGYVSSTKPLSYAGTIISGMKFTFKDGKVVDFSAEQGEEALKNLLAIDEGAKHLGEVALVPDPSPISQSGLIFYNTLFDENASNHLAFGSAYAFNLQGGTEMSEEELAEAGLNRSQTHVDFMVGSDKMNIDGIKEDGTIVPVFRNGDWA
ncbi:thermophilic metalloprotease (M29) [Enterococcus faecalis TX4248]|jgi:aminopeptidase|uniref:Thermophilic metalloprotease (M29) n=1 Tax=Enterococcus faecalis TX4248 TaxID=749495 RepID=A0A125W3S5_ENTFL|nr:aminopeptidase PepS [Enterococcus faecalis OG1RF]EFM71585.1 thermophilic metalloprotease (M29) [Enterococcus faecalis TX0109]EFM81913.1 thermophilic metalloprotease (M29) [Enterococcus faecalis TX4248]EFT47641.1 thermophilic metalloprotease (M29) [Enterococcus faecalis TX0027]EFU01133.1 thermophilic metalloprotease (M29) [Enterococcus faecalis TX0043]EFU08326.1 thermophilic metalloprotease (M29) [Enterococcus faecalis TX1302]EPH92985.1 aminopeptidase PepS [Enterococcus faecalis F01966]